MKKNPHIIVQQVCPMKKAKGGKYEVQVARVVYKGIMARGSIKYLAHRHGRFSQHSFCTTNNASRLRCASELKNWIKEKGVQQ